jgi:hypothetical protein
MTSEEIVSEVRTELNRVGQNWRLKFKVSDEVRKDGAWLQVFIQSNSTKDNAAAERQIIADVESDLSDKTGQELLLVPVHNLIATP